jgi:hypothetical protein
MDNADLMKTIRDGLTAQISEAANDDNVPPLVVQMVTQSWLLLQILDRLESIYLLQRILAQNSGEKK